MRKIFGWWLVLFPVFIIGGQLAAWSSLLVAFMRIMLILDHDEKDK